MIADSSYSCIIDRKCLATSVHGAFVKDESFVLGWSSTCHPLPPFWLLLATRWTIRWWSMTASGRIYVVIRKWHCRTFWTSRWTRHCRVLCWPRSRHCSRLVHCLSLVAKWSVRSQPQWSLVWLWERILLSSSPVRCSSSLVCALKRRVFKKRKRVAYSYCTTWQQMEKIMVVFGSYIQKSVASFWPKEGWFTKT